MASDKLKMDELVREIERLRERNALLEKTVDALDKKENYNQLLLNEAKLKAFFESAPIGIARNSMDGKFIEINPEFQKFTGYNKDELNALTYWDLTPKEYADDESIQLKLLETHGMYGPYKKEYIHKDGHRFPVLLHGKIITGLDGESFIWSTVQDVTEIDNTCKMLEISLEKLKISNEELRSLTYVTSHDLQEPLRAIMSYLQLVITNKKSELDSQTMIYVQKAIAASKRMRNLVVDLLSFSQVDDDSVELVEIDVNQVIQECLTNLSSQIDKHQAIINVPEENIQIQGYKNLIHRVFQNILSNGIKYHQPDTQPIIDVTYTSTEENHQISIADNGIGIDEKHKDDVFEMFHRLNKRENYAGTGIGLALVNKIIQKHQGSIWFESDGKSGTKFIFTIPKLLVTKQNA